MKCTDGEAGIAAREDFGKQTVVILEKTHYNRECPNAFGQLPFVVREYGSD